MYYDFDWTEAPLSSPAVPTVAGVVYVAIVVALPHFVPAGGVKGLAGVLAAHNMLLSAWSLLMFLGCLLELVVRVREEDNSKWMFCEHPGAEKARGPVYFWSYIFYISKYYELVDTFLALLKGSKPPHFLLHVYHHALVPIVTWHWLEYRATLQHIGLLWNTFVHIFMYAYYALKVLGKPTPWKNWVTRLQIVQFVSSLACFCVTITYLKGHLDSSQCAGTVVLFVTIAFNATLLWQFIGVLYSAPRGKQTKKVS